MKKDMEKNMEITYNFLYTEIPETTTHTGYDHLELEYVDFTYDGNFEYFYVYTEYDFNIQ